MESGRTAPPLRKLALPPAGSEDGAMTAGIFFENFLQALVAGLLVGAPLIIVQWQNGLPVTVGPAEFAAGKAIWIRKQA